MYLKMQGLMFFILFVCSLLSFSSTSSAGRTDMHKQEANTYAVEFLPLTPQLVRSSVKVGNNGLSLFVLEVTNADQSDCMFNVFDDEGDVGMNMVYRTDNKIIGTLLIRQEGPHHTTTFSCYSKDKPVGAKYVIHALVESEPFDESIPTEEYECMISQPRHMNSENAFKVELLVSCSNNLTWDDIGIRIEGSVLQDGDIYSLWDKITYDESYGYENGIMKARFVFPKNISTTFDILPTFSVEFKDQLKRNVNIYKKHFLANERSLDGRSPAIRLGNVAMILNPRELLYVRRGFNHRLYCRAYGNPKPNLMMYKDTTMIEGKTDFVLGWDHFSNIKYFKIDGMDESYEGMYTCVAEVGMKTVSRTIDVRLCTPAHVSKTVSSDDYYVNVTLTASHDETNKIGWAGCYKSTLKIFSNWMYAYITENKNDDNRWSQTYSLPRIEFDPLSIVFSCTFRGICKMDDMTFTIGI